MSIDRRVDKEEAVHVHSGTLLRQEKDPNHAFVATWMQAEIIILSEARKRDTRHVRSLLCGI